MCSPIHLSSLFPFLTLFSPIHIPSIPPPSTPYPQLIHINTPDLVLFVGEALVGNEAVDQLVKFNRALIDHAHTDMPDPRGIDGIVLTKFDTIDDKVCVHVTTCSYTVTECCILVHDIQYFHLMFSDLKGHLSIFVLLL